MLAGDEVLGLDLLAAGRGEVHLEVGHALVPGAGSAELLGAGLGSVAGYGVELFFLQGGSVEERRQVMDFIGRDTALNPDLLDAMVLPVGEEAEAVAGAEDVVEVVLELGEGKILVDDLAHLEGRLDVEGDGGDDTERAEVDDGAEEVVAVLLARDVDDVSVGGDDFKRCDLGGEVSVAWAGAVRRGGDGSGDGDVRERREVVEGVTLLVEPGRELAVGDASADGDGAGSLVDRHGGEGFERNLILGAVGDAVEGVAGAEGAEFGAGFDDLLDLSGGGGGVEIVGVEDVVAGPVGARGCSGFAEGDAGDHAAGDECSGGLQEISLVH